MEQLQAIRKDALSNGLILGLVLFALDIATLYVLSNSHSMFAIILTYLFTFLIIPLTIAIILIKRLRKSIGGYWTLRQATSGIFIMLFAAHFISSAGSFVFINVKPQITVNAKNNFVNVFSNFMSKANADQEKIDQTVQNIEQQFDSMAKPQLGSFFSSLMSSIIVVFITALILAAIFKRENPLTDQA